MLGLLALVLTLPQPFVRSFALAKNVNVTFSGLWSDDSDIAWVDIGIRRPGHATRRYHFKDAFGGHAELIACRFQHSNWLLLANVTEVRSAVGAVSNVWAINSRTLSCRMIMEMGVTRRIRTLRKGYVVEQIVPRWAENPPKAALDNGDQVSRVHRFDPKTGGFRVGPWHIVKDAQNNRPN